MAGLTISTHPSIRRLAFRLNGLVRTQLWLKVILGMLAGIATGMAIGPTGGLLPQETALVVSNWLATPGYLFLSMVQMIVIPLVVASIILGMTSTDDMKQLRSIGVRTVIFFIFTTVVAVVIGLFMVDLIRPGDYLSHLTFDASLRAAQTETLSMADLPSRIVSIIPTNPIQAGVEQNMLQVVVFALFGGVALVTMAPEQAKPLLDLLGAIQEVSMVVVRWAMYLVPFAVFGLMTQLTARMGLEALLGMSVYVVTVLSALLIAFAFYLLLYTFLRRRSPLFFLRNSRDVLLLAFSTSSSAVVMPLSIRTAEEKLAVQKSVARLVIPLGTTINMAGTALYQAVATIFLAQVYDVNISTMGLVLVVVLAVGASIGSPGTPGVGVVILSMLLGSVGIPAEGIALIMGVDRILDMCRTTLNVSGDLIAASIIDQFTADSIPAEAATKNPEQQIERID